MWQTMLASETAVIYAGTGGLSTWWDGTNNQPYVYNDTSSDEFSGNITMAYTISSNVKDMSGVLGGSQATMKELEKCYFNANDLSTPLDSTYQLLSNGAGIYFMIYMIRENVVMNCLSYELLRFTSPSDGLSYILIHRNNKNSIPT